MKTEETKVREFFEKLKKIDMNSWAAWFFVGLGILFLIIGCAAPAQAYFEAGDEVAVLMAVIVSFVGPFTAYMRINPFTVYTENQKGRTILDLVKYYPINKREIKKFKIFCMAKFMAKVLPFCMLVQIPATLYDYGKLSIINFIYIFVLAFAWPVILNIVGIAFEK